MGQHLGLISKPCSLFAVLITERLLKAAANQVFFKGESTLKRFFPLAIA